MAEGDHVGVQVLHRQAKILDCFTGSRPRLRASDVQSLTGLPTTTVARILRSLVEEKLLQRTGGHYSIGLRVMAWAAAASAGSDLIAASQMLVAEMRERTDETCIVYVRQGSHRVAVLIDHSTQSIIYQGHVGQILPLGAGAAGKLFMALDSDAYDAALAGGLEQFTTSTLVDRDRLDHDLEITRERGWAFAPEEREQGLSSMAAPLIDTHGALIGALAIGAPVFRLSMERADALAPDLLESARMISQRLH